MIRTREIINQVRRVMQDTSPNSPRTSDEDIRAAISLALSDVRRMRPDLFYPAPDVYIDAYTAEEIPLEGFILSPLAYITAAHAVTSMDQMAKAGLGENYMNIGKTALAAVA